ACASELGAGEVTIADGRRVPQCWQKANPTGVCLLQLGQGSLTDPETSPRGVGVASGRAAVRSSRVPHILQKFIPALLTVPQRTQVGLSTGAGASAATAGAGCGAATRWPQLWQNSALSRFTFPHLEQRGIGARLWRLIYTVGGLG